jgi:hypothetical protein
MSWLSLGVLRILALLMKWNLLMTAGGPMLNPTRRPELTERKGPWTIIGF